MTRINTASRAVLKPDSGVIGEMAIAAGLVGQPIAVCFAESTATMDCELWKYLSTLARPSRVLNVNSQKDVTTLRKTVGHWRVIVVQVPRPSQYRRLDHAIAGIGDVGPPPLFLLISFGRKRRRTNSATGAA